MKKVVKYSLIEILILVILSIPMGQNIDGDKLYFKDVFLYVRPVSLLIFLYFVSEDIPFCSNIFLWVRDFYSRCYIYIWDICLIAFLGGYQLWYAYYVSFYISPDSSQYLREALNILAGYGFNNNGLLGLDGWFSAWPIGYPVLIAFVSKITTFNVYLSSKLLSALMMSALLTILQKKFHKSTFLVTLLFFNAGFLFVYKYTWSEIPFIFFIVMYGFSLTDVIQKKDKKSSLMLGVWTVLAFLMRYAGAYLGIISGITWIRLLISYLHDGRKNKVFKKNLLYLFVSGILSAVFIGCYLLNNYVHCGFMTGVSRTLMKDDYRALTYNLQRSLLDEILHVFNVMEADYVKDLEVEGLAWILLILLIGIIWIVRKKSDSQINVRTIFICIGGFYYLLFIYTRFHSTMDEFGSRFFIPGSLLIEIAFLDYVSEHIKNYIKTICLISTMILFVITSSIWSNIVRSKYEDSAYAVNRNAVLLSLKDVPANSYVFGEIFAVPDVHYQERVYRPDITFDGYPYFSSYEALLNFVNAKADEGYGYVCILRSVFEKFEGYETICDNLSIDREDKSWETMILDAKTYKLLLK